MALAAVEDASSLVLAELSSRTEQAQSLRAELSAAQAALKHHKAAAAAELQEAKAAAAGIESKLADLQLDLDASNRKLDLALSRCAEAEGEVEAMLAARDAERESLHERVQVLERQIQAAQQAPAPPPAIASPTSDEARAVFDAELASLRAAFSSIARPAEVETPPVADASAAEIQQLKETVRSLTDELQAAKSAQPTLQAEAAQADADVETNRLLAAAQQGERLALAAAEEAESRLLRLAELLRCANEANAALVLRMGGVAGTDTPQVQEGGEKRPREEGPEADQEAAKRLHEEAPAPAAEAMAVP